MEYDIFISYSRKDAQIVDQFVRALIDAGFRVWIDRDSIYSGDQFKAKIVQAIKKSAIVLFFSSINSNASEWTVKEISYSLKKGKTIIPIRLDDSEYEDSIDFDLVNIDFIPYNPRQQSSAIDRLKSSIAVQCGKPAADVTSSSSTAGPSPEELNDLGFSYYENKNYKQAFEYFKSAAEQGCSDAQNNLAICYMYGRGVQRDDNEAAKWYRKAAEQGHARAQYGLGICYKHGCGATQDSNEAVKWIKLAAEQGYANAQYNLSSCYLSGFGVEKNLYEAAKWCRKAAEQGLIDAQYDLGSHYYYGLGVPEDDNEAAKWYRKAAEQGHADAQYKLGAYYQYGRGVTQDYKEAIKWYRKAAEQGNETAIKALKELEEY